MSANLNPEKALIFRIVHRDNLSWVLDHGLHCRNSETVDPNYRNIGNPELISKRTRRVVPISPGDATRLRPVLFHAILNHVAQYQDRLGWDSDCSK